MTENPNDVFDLIHSLLDSATRRKVAFADVRAVAGRSTSLLVQDRRAEKMFYSDGVGLALRVLIDGAWGFASCDGFNRRAANDALDQAIALARDAAPNVADLGQVASVEPVIDRQQVLGRLDPDQVSLERKRDICQDLEAKALAAGQGKIVNSLVGYGDGMRETWIVNSLGAEVYFSIGRAKVSCQVTAVEGDIRQRNFQVMGHQGGPELLTELNPEELSVKAAKKVLFQLRAKKAPAGTFPAIFHSTISGLLAHEALGHNSEADGIWTGESVLQGKFGEKIGSDLVTIVDDATIPGKYGSEPYDSEGVPTRRREIVKNGVFQEMLHNLETAARFGTVPNGCGRAESHTAVPLCRMSNTFFAPGESKFEDMLKGIDRGIYLREGMNGYVYPERGQFVCHANEAQMIEHGRLGEPLRDVSVSGLILETLQNIDMVGDDFQMIFPGTCGKGGQGVPTDCGGPHLRVKEIVVGGQD